MKQLPVLPLFNCFKETEPALDVKSMTYWLHQLLLNPLKWVLMSLELFLVYDPAVSQILLFIKLESQFRTKKQLKHKTPSLWKSMQSLFRKGCLN